MVWQEQQSHKQPDYKALNIDKPGFGGLNIKDLDFMLRPNESPKMKNMMVKDGVFKKRYGQGRLTDISVKGDFYPNASELTWAHIKPVMYEFHRNLFIMFPKQVRENAFKFFIYRWNGGTLTTVMELDGTDTTDGTLIYKADPEPDTEYYKVAAYENGYTTYNTGIFFISNGNLYCMATYPMCDGHSFDGKFFRGFVFAKYNESKSRFEMLNLTNDIYTPTVAINCTPLADYYDVDGMDEFNLLCPVVRIEYNSDGEERIYHVPRPFIEQSRLGYVIKVEVDEQVADPSTYQSGFGVIAFKKNHVPAKGQNNVALTISTTTDPDDGTAFSDYAYLELAAEILGAQFSTEFGGTNNSRLFVGGVSKRYFYSEVNDPSYFPASAYGVAGYDGEKITGFGHHYKDLIVFKENSIYTLKYQYGSDTNGEMRGLIYSQPVNQEIGCDAPNTIKKINNRLTWLSSKYGVCTLVSTVLEDERNVCVISRNVAEGERQIGMLAEANQFSFAVDFDGKYILFNNQTSGAPFESGQETPGRDVFKRCYPEIRNVYVWDYSISPFYLSERSSAEDSARNTSWYLWDKFYATVAYRFNNELLFMDYRFLYDIAEEDNHTFRFSLNRFISQENDFGESVDAYYQTPMFDFGNYGYLKTIKKIYIQCRGGITYDTAITYLTDENETGDDEPENLTSGIASLWDDFAWDSFTWGDTYFAKTFARKCSLKKVEMAGIFFSNNMTNYDMPINGLQLLYTLVKEIK